MLISDGGYLNSTAEELAMGTSQSTSSRLVSKVSSVAIDDGLV